MNESNLLQKSEQINELVMALAKAQGDIHGAIKDSDNPFFKSKYADHASVWEACRIPLTKNGLAVIQVTNITNDKLVLLTMLAHSSGQWVCGIYPINPVKPDPQSVKSAVTYAKRTTLASIAGVPEIDDDGNAASDTKGEHLSHNIPPQRFVPPQSRIAIAETPKENEPARVYSATEAQLKRLFAISRTAGWNNDDVKNMLHSRYNLESTKDLNYHQYNELCDYLQRNPQNQPQPAETPIEDQRNEMF